MRSELLKKALTFNRLAVFSGIVFIGFLLVGRYSVAMTRFFDSDEFLHLYRAYLLSEGKVPYRDFGYTFTPLFASLFTPLFSIFKEQVTVIFLARSLAMVVFLLNLLTIYLIGHFSFGPRAGILAAYIWTFSPIAFWTTVEIRPDNLAILFWLVCFLILLLVRRKSGGQKMVLISGMCFGLSLAICFKTVFAYPAILISLWVINRVSWKKLFRSIWLFHFGLAIPWVILGVYFWFQGTLDQAVYSVLILPQELNQILQHPYWRNQNYFPLRIFAPDDFLYGVGGRNLTWFLSNMVFLLGLAGLIHGVARMALRKEVKPVRLFLFLSFIGFAWSIIFFYNYTHYQYYLPLTVIMSLAVAGLWSFLEDKLLHSRGRRICFRLKSLISFALFPNQGINFWNKDSRFIPADGGVFARWNKYLGKSKAILLTVWVLLLSVLSLGFGRLVQDLANPRFRNDWQATHLKNILAISKPGDHIVDMAGLHFFREPGYFLCCERYDLFSQSLSRPLPDFAGELKRTETKFVVSWHLNYLTEPSRAFIDGSYFPTGIDSVLTAGKRISFALPGPQVFELVAGGDYRVSKEGDGQVMIDGQMIKEEIIFLGHGKHLAEGKGVKELFLLYDFAKQINGD